MSLLPPAVHVPATPAIEGIDIRSLYDIDHSTLLGKGGFSEVLACRHVPTNELRAIKVMKRDVLVGKKGEMVAHEKEILRRTCHPSIVTLYETVQNADKIYFALDLMNEDLFEFIVRNKKINETLTRKIVFALLSAVNYLHEQSIVHRDIKPENVLLNVRYTGPLPSDDEDEDERDSSSGGRGASKAAPSTNTFANVSNINDIDPNMLEVDVKLADFGLAKLVVEWDVRSTPCGTSFYIAPEVIRGIEEQGARPLVTTQRLVKSVDVWSAGVVFYVLLCGRPPFHGQVKTGEERRALLKKIDHGVLFNPHHGWDAVSEEAKDLIARMLEQDSAKRITAAECLRHPFFTQHGFTKPTPGGDPMKLVRQQQQLATQRQKLREMQSGGARGVPAGAEDGGAPTSFSSEEQNGAFIVGEGSASVRAQMQQQQHQQDGNGAAGATASESNNSTPRAPERVAKAKKSNNLFSNMKYFFTGGHHGSNGGDKNAKDREEQQQMHAELEALRQDVIAAEDKEGDDTAYKPTAPLREAKPAKPAMMNTNVKVGPGALKR